jgi:hypothetical protein
VKAKIINVMEEDWDFLIVLDACRFDYFSEVYQGYFDGKLEKIISTGCSTVEWLKRSFTGYYPDVIYISGNPYINSKMMIGGFNAKRHFYKIVDVWDFGWDSKLGTVPPREINKATLRYYLKYPQKRFIVHYLQPHAPYLSAKFRQNGYEKLNPKNGKVLSNITGYGRANRCFESMLNVTGTLLSKLNIIESSWALREKIGLPPTSPMDVVRRKYGKNGLIEAYKENLNIVLDYVAKLCSKLPRKKIVITSDHGELLGEGGAYEHPNGPIDKIFNNLFLERKKILQEVPWLRVFV